MEKIERENKLQNLLEIEDIKELYDFLQKNGYSKSESEFKAEIEALIEENPINLEDSELDSVAGGRLKDSITKIASSGMASLMMLGASPLSSQVHAGSFVSTQTKQAQNPSVPQTPAPNSPSLKKNNPNAKKIILAALGVGGAGTAIVGIGGLSAYLIYKNCKKNPSHQPTQQPPKRPAPPSQTSLAPQQQVTHNPLATSSSSTQNEPGVTNPTLIRSIVNPDAAPGSSTPTPQPSQEVSPTVSENPSPSQSPDLAHETTHSSDDDNDENNIINTEPKEDITDDAQQTTSTHSDDVDQPSSSFSASTSHSGVSEESPDHISKQETKEEDFPQQPQQKPSPLPPSAVQPPVFTPIKFNPQHSTLAPPEFPSFPPPPSYQPSPIQFSTTTNFVPPPPINQSTNPFTLQPIPGQPLSSPLGGNPPTFAYTPPWVQSNNDQKTQPSGSLPPFHGNRSTVANKAANIPPSPVAAGVIPKKEQVSPEEIENLQSKIAVFTRQTNSDFDLIQEFYSLDSVSNFKQNVNTLGAKQVDSSNYEEIKEKFESLKSQYDNNIKNTLSKAQYIKDYLWEEGGDYNLNDKELNEVYKMTKHIEELLGCGNLSDLLPENILNGDECNLNNCYCYLCFAVCNYLRSNFEWLGDLDSFNNHFINNNLQNLLSSCNKCLNRLMIVSALTNNETNKTNVSKCIEYLRNKLSTIKELDSFENSVSGDDRSLFTNDDINVLHELVSNGENVEPAIFNRTNNDFKYLSSLLKGFKNHCNGTVSWSSLKIKACSAPNSTAMSISEYLTDSNKQIDRVTIITADSKEFSCSTDGSNCTITERIN